MKTIKIVSAVLILSIAIASCGKWNNAQKGGAIGAGAGAATGAAIGKHSGNTLAGAIIGAAIGGGAGVLIGNYMDKQAAELREDLKNATVERVGEGIKITFDSGILFDVNSHSLKAETQSNLVDLARVLKKYEDTNILIEGHTDNTGTDSYNKTLSEQRAEEVSAYLKTQGVTGGRITNHGYGEEQPIAENDTEAGRTQNRRVDVAIFANKKLKKAAENGQIGVR
jgi:outer membrane protein OmpA-like peptidoglycan-associated protein